MTSRVLWKCQHGLAVIHASKLLSARRQFHFHNSHCHVLHETAAVFLKLDSLLHVRCRHRVVVQVKELGLYIRNCPAAAQDFVKVRCFLAFHIVL
jgi:hypothetical protein